jgi:hypothetical protein
MGFGNKLHNTKFWRCLLVELGVWGGVSSGAVRGHAASAPSALLRPLLRADCMRLARGLAYLRVRVCPSLKW